MSCLTDFCFLCFVNKGDLKNIASQDSDGIFLYDKLQYLVPEHALITSEIQKHICNRCLNSINNTYKFRQKCIKNIFTLNDYINKMVNQGSSNRSSITLTDILRHKKAKKPKGNIQNRDIEPNHIAKIRQKAIKIEEPSSFHENPIVDNCFSENKVETVLIKTEDNDGIEQNDLNEELLEEDAVFLPDNFKEDSSIDDISVQQELTNDFRVVNEQIIEGAPQRAHENVPTSSASTRTVIIRPRVKKLHKCSECHKIFRHKHHLDGHFRVHTGERPYECKICHKKFAQASNLNTHKRIHNNDKALMCMNCPEVFTNFRDFNAHKLSHIHTRLFPCTICDKVFTQNGDLVKHIRIHSGEKPFQCQFCQYKTTQTSNLKQHVRTHTGEKPYHCKICDKYFSKTTNLNRHIINWHTKDK